MNIQVLTQKQKLVDAEGAVKITLTTTTGQIQVLPEHQNLISTLEPGRLIIQFENQKQQAITIFVRSGVINVNNNNILILADEAIESSAIIKEEVENALNLAKQKLSEPDIPPAELIALEKILRYEKFKLDSLSKV